MWEWLKDPAVKVVKQHPDGLVEVHKACEQCLAKDVELARLRDDNKRLSLNQKPPAQQLPKKRKR